MADARNHGSRNLRKYPPILFDEARRREFIDPSLLVDLVELRAGAKVADFGAGAGFFTLPLAKAVGPRGNVTAVDINPNNLSIIRGKAEQERLGKVITLVEGNIERPATLPVKAASLDFVILSSVLSQLSDIEAVLETAERSLKPGGKLVVFEWHQRDMLLGPPAKARISKEQVINLLFLGSQKFKLLKDVDAGFYHYCLVFSKLAAREQRS